MHEVSEKESENEKEEAEGQGKVTWNFTCRKWPNLRFPVLFHHVKQCIEPEEKV